MVFTAVYADGLFGADNPPVNAREAKALLDAEFTAAILFAFHVHPTGDLYYNDSLIVSQGVFASAFEYLPELVALLRGSGEVWASLGGWGVDDFANIGRCMQDPTMRKTLAANLRALLDAIPINGFDCDMEGPYDPAMRATITGFTSLATSELGTQVTFCPYVAPDFWFDCLADLYAANQHQPVTRMNLQCYAGGTGNTTATWVTALAGFTRATGVNARAFLVPGNWVRSDDGTTKNSPAEIEAFFHQTAIRDGAAGGFLWCTSEIFASGFTAHDYAGAVSNGLQAA